MLMTAIKAPLIISLHTGMEMGTKSDETNRKEKETLDWTTSVALCSRTRYHLTWEILLVWKVDTSMWWGSRLWAQSRLSHSFSALENCCCKDLEVLQVYELFKYLHETHGTLPRNTRIWTEFWGFPLTAVVRTTYLRESYGKRINVIYSTPDFIITSALVAAGTYIIVWSQKIPLWCQVSLSLRQTAHCRPHGSRSGAEVG